MVLVSYVVWAVDLKSEIRSDLRGCKRGPYHISKMHMDMLVFEATDFKSEVRSNLRDCLQAAVGLEAVKRVCTI